VAGPGLARLLRLAAAALLVVACATSTSPGKQEALPGADWGEFISRACEWSEERTPPGECFGTREVGFRVRVVRRAGDRWLIWDPTTRGTAYVDRTALSVPEALTRDPAVMSPSSTTAVLCIDRSRPYRYTVAAAGGIAAWIEARARPGDVYYFRWIEENSYRPEAELVNPLRLRAPDQPPVPQPAPPVRNPFSAGEKATATATTAQREAVLKRAQEQQEALDQEVRAAAGNYADHLRSLRPPPAGAADVIGCMRKGAELLASSTGDKWLVLASQMEHSGDLRLDFRLDGVRARVVYFQCDNAARCGAVKQQWAELVAGAGAADGLRYFDPSQGMLEIEK
jgi:hypothetical protein